ncbi:MAG TPA: alpha-glucosidase, partial [Microcoleaceae cyanobacterium]
MTLDQVKSLNFTESLHNRFKDLSLKFKFFLGSLFYLTYAPYAYRYSRQRDRLEQQFTPPPSTEVIDSPGKLLRAESWARGAYFYFERAELEVYFLKPDFVQLTWQPGLLPVPYALAKSIDHTAWQSWSEVSVELNPTSDGWTVSSDELQIT